MSTTTSTTTTGELPVIDLDNVVDLLRQAVATRGEDYVFPGARFNCAYAEDDGTPSCLVGVVLDLVRPGAAQAADTAFVGSARFLPEYADKIGVNITPEAADVLVVAQNCQDAGVPWGSAYQAAAAFARPDESVPYTVAGGR